jgi:ubiquinone/menaquinone biosynthesis C-methylase UbiE
VSVAETWSMYDNFNRSWRSLLWPESSFIEDLVAACELKSGTRMLDVGCGTGSLLERAVYDEPGALLYGVEPTPDALNVARRRLGGSGERVHLLEGCGQSLPFENNSFDVIALTMVLDELGLATRHRVLAETRRVLATGGHVLVADWSAAWPAWLALAAAPARVLAQAAGIGPDPPDDRGPGYELESAGFSQPRLVQRFVALSGDVELWKAGKG